MLPLVILLSSFVGAVVGVSLIAFARRGRNVPIPFGPYLAVAGLIALFHGEALTRRYLDLVPMAPRRMRRSSWCRCCSKPDDGEHNRRTGDAREVASIAGAVRRMHELRNAQLARAAARSGGALAIAAAGPSP